VYRQPYHLTLLAFASLCDVERVDRALERGHELRRAFDVNFAVNGPDQLTKALQDYQMDLRAPPGRKIMTLEEAHAIADRLEERRRTATYRKVEVR
jgi:hypothetical protein